MIETTADDYDPFIVVAANRQVVRLKNGFTGRLVWWSKAENAATVIVGGRHLRITKDQVMCVVE